MHDILSDKTSLCSVGVIFYTLRTCMDISLVTSTHHLCTGGLVADARPYATVNGMFNIMPRYNFSCAAPTSSVSRLVDPYAVYNLAHVSNCQSNLSTYDGM